MQNLRIFASLATYLKGLTNGSTGPPQLVAILPVEACGKAGFSVKRPHEIVDELVEIPVALAEPFDLADGVDDG